MFYRKTSQIAVIISCVLASSSAFAVIANSAEVYLKADEGSWVGGGIGAPSATWVHGIDGVFYGGPNYGSFERGVQINYDNGEFWSFEFAAPMYNPKTNAVTGQPLHVGLYTGAQRFPFNSPTKPGLSITGNGRGNNTLSGWFNVLEISYDNYGNLDKFAVDFKQFDEFNTTIGLYGSLRFNSSIAINPIPEPNTTVLMLLGLTGLAAVGLKRGK